MLEFFRRHRGAFLITLTVIIIISFSVWGGWKEDTRGQGQAEGDLAFTVYGEDYTRLQASRLQNQMRLVGMLQLFDLYSLNSVAQSPETQGGDFIFNSLVLKHEMEKLGIHPSDADAKAALEKLPSLQDNGKFSVERAQMAEMNVGMYGMSGQDMLDIVKLDIGFKKLQDLLAKNYVPSPVEIEKAYASRYQTLKISTIDFSLADFKKAAQVTDAELQKYYDEKKESYKTPEKRSLSYIFFEEPKADEKRPAEETQKQQKAVVDRVNNFDDAIAKDTAKKFADVAQDLKEKVLTLPAFSREEAPEAIKSESELIDAIFAYNNETRHSSIPIKGSKGYYVFTVDKVEEPTQQDLAAVKDKIKETLVGQKAQEALSKAVNDARTALQDGLKAGKKIDDLVKEKKLTLSPQTELTVSEPPATLPNGSDIAEAAKHTAAGQVTSVISTETGATLAYVASKELRKREDSAALRKSLEDSTARSERMRIVSAWFAKKRLDAKVKMSPKLNKNTAEG